MKLKSISLLFLVCIAFSTMYAQQWNASGVVISSAGYIATSNHTLPAGYHFEIDVFNNGIKRTYPGTLLKSDPTNDLAIVRIEDPLFAAVGSVPYSIKVKDVKENEKVFVMGFPQEDSKGEKMKVTEGAISSKSGYANDISNYQLSCVMRKGNEGSPVFDNSGNLIGIINSKTGQSMGYAVKASCLNNLLETLPKIPAMPAKSGLYGLSSSDREEAISKFIVVIRMSNQSVAETAAKNKKMQVGQTYGGGIIFDSGEHGLIASIDNGESKRAQWGCTGTEVGETESGIGTGKENTKKIIVTCRTTGSAEIAARLCNQAIIDGYSDWFLPSKEELNLLYENKEIIGGYEHGYYWSSSEFSADFAWYQHFDFGFQDYLKKDFSYYYRPIRAF
jgi:hypothetical protein